ncbi:MAG TPA: type IV pilus assembly protein PilM [Candidatus Saccharimonadales bacterium]|nr:type IV pilus assembly protein PilM [Candidatus Saccharimonadales bacterium]
MGTKTKLFYHDKPLVGIDISSTGIKAMAINQRKMTVLGYGSIDLDPQKVNNSLTAAKDDYLADGVRQLLREKIHGKLPSNHVAISVPTSRTYSRTLELPLDAEANLSDSLQLEVEQYIPIAASELYIDHQIVERNKENITVLLTAVPKKIVDASVASCEKAGLQVVLVEPGISSAARLIRRTEEGHLPTIVIDVGAATSDIALVDQVVRVTGSAPVGGHTVTYTIADKLKVSFEEAHQLKVHSGLAPGPKQNQIRLALEPVLTQVAQETRKIMRYYAERLGAKTKIEQILIVGGGSNLPGLGEFMTDAMLMPSRVANPWHSISFGHLTPPSKLFKPRYITAAGLGIIDPKEIWQ